MSAPSRSVNIYVRGMSCGSCVSRVESVLSRIDGIENAEANLTTGRVKLHLRDADTAPAYHDLRDAIRKAGYELASDPPDASQSGMQDGEAPAASAQDDQSRALRFAALFGGPVLALHALTMLGVSPLPATASTVVYVGLTTALLASSAAWPILRAGGRALWYRSPNMDLLVSLGVLVAFLASLAALACPALRPGHFPAVAMILLFINLGRWLERRVKHRATEALSLLAQRLPRRALRVSSAAEHEHKIGEADLETVDVAALTQGDVVRVPADTVIPVDGKVAGGEAAVDESPLTGESVPVHRHANDDVTAGCLVVDGQIDIRVQKTGSDTVMGHIISAVEAAQSGKTRMQRLADRVAGVFVPIVLGLALATLLVWLLATDEAPVMGIRAAIAVVVIACPCAMGLATPVAVAAATGTAAKLGILMRNAPALEQAGLVQTMLLDKTGTLTTGRPCVHSVFDDPVGPITLSADEVLSLAASAEQYSQHPLARAITAHAREKQVGIREPDEFRNLPGRGVKATLDGKRILVGSVDLLTREQVDLAPVRGRVAKHSEDGDSIVLVSVDGQLAGMIAARDEVKPRTAEALRGLRGLNIECVMVTGDLDTTARAVASRIGIQKILAGMLPEDKQKQVEQKQAEGRITAFVGDGINDAPAMAAANVSITFGNATDVARGVADITIIHDDLTRLPQIIELARRARIVIRQNLAWAFGYNALMLPLAATGHVPPGWAAAAMMLSSISVVLNALRLRHLPARMEKPAA